MAALKTPPSSIRPMSWSCPLAARSGAAGFSAGGAGAARSPLDRLGHDHQLGDLLTGVRICICTGFLGPVEDEIDATGTLRIPRVGLIGRF